MAVIFKNDYYELRAESNVLRLVRTSKPFDDLTTVKSSDEEIARVLWARSPREPHALLDLRGGPPGRNDTDFESATESSRKALSRGFSRVAVLVRTQAGRLQVTRISRAADATPHVFLDEREALTWLAEGDRK